MRTAVVQGWNLLSFCGRGSTVAPVSLEGREGYVLLGELCLAKGADNPESEAVSFIGTVFQGICYLSVAGVSQITEHAQSSYADVLVKELDIPATRPSVGVYVRKEIQASVRLEPLLRGLLSVATGFVALAVDP